MKKFIISILQKHIDNITEHVKSNRKATISLGGGSLADIQQENNKIILGIHPIKKIYSQHVLYTDTDQEHAEY